MKKRIIAVLLAAVLSVSGLLAGCGNNDAKDKETAKKTESSTESSDAKSKEEKSAEEKKKETVIKPGEKSNNSQGEDGDIDSDDTEDRDNSDRTDKDSSNDTEQDTPDDEDISGNEQEDSSDNDNSGESQTLSGTVQEISSSAIAIKVENDGIYIFELDNLSGMDESIQAGDGVVIQYDGDVTDPDSAEISLQ